MVNAAMEMNTNITAQVMIATNISEPTDIETGLRQGGTFSTTGAKLALQELNEPVRANKGVLMGANDAHITNIEFADDEFLLAVSPSHHCCIEINHDTRKRRYEN